VVKDVKVIESSPTPAVIEVRPPVSAGTTVIVKP
jgi:hypothetical protein